MPFDGEFDGDFAERESNNPETIACLWLVRNGVPFDVAFSLGDEERLAWVVIFGRFEGGTFDWRTRAWGKPT